MNQTTNQGYNLVENTDEIQTSLNAWNGNFNKIDGNVTRIQQNIKVLEDNFDTDTTPNSNNFVLEDSASGYNKGNIKIGNGPELKQVTKSYKGMFRVPEALNQTINGLTFKVNDDGSVSVSGTSTEATTINVDLNESIILNGTYTFSIKLVDVCPANKHQWLLRDSNGNIGLSVIPSTNTTKTKTVENITTTATSLRVYTAENATIDCTIYPILETGDTATEWDSAETKLFSPTPDHQQDIVVIEGNANIIDNNKNLLHLKNYSATTNPSRRSSGSTASNVGDNSITITSTGTYSHTELVFDDLLIKNEDAVITGIFDETISGRTSMVGFSIAGSDDKEDYTTIQTNFVEVTAGTSQKISQTFNIGSYKYIRIRIYANNTGTSASGLSSVNVSNLMLLYGTDDTFIPYKGQTYPITLPTGMFLGSMGTASNYIYGTKDNWKLHTALGKLILNGAETDFNIVRSKTNSTYFEKNTAIWKKTSSTLTANIKCNRLPAIKADIMYNGDVEGITFANPTSGAAKVRFNLLNTVASTVAELQDWLSTNNMIIYGELSTPTDTDITDSTLVTQLNNIVDNLQTYKGGTVLFTTSENLEPNIQFDYLVNPFASIEARLALLEE